MRFNVRHSASLLLATLSLSTLSSCAATLDAKMQTLVPGQRLRPPGKDENRVYIEFQDQTGEGSDFENRVYEAICTKVEEKGYDIVNHDEADYVLWTTLRLFDRVGKDEGDKVLAGLGGIAGGVATGVVVAELTENERLSGLLSGPGWSESGSCRRGGFLAGERADPAN